MKKLPADSSQTDFARKEGTEMENLYQLPDTLLIIDDNEINRVILREIFSQGYRIKEASNGAEGWKQLEEHQDRVCAI